MDVLNSHAGAIYFAMMVINLIAVVVIASALVSIAISLRHNKREK